MKRFKRFVQDESGATAIEYALIASLISIGVISGAGALGSDFSAAFSYMAGQMKTS